jgi:hypothetical protein
MAAKLYINPAQPRYGQGRKYEELVQHIGSMEPDGAVFVTYREMARDATTRREQVLQLRAGVRSNVRTRGIVVIEDFAKGGVWVYRPAGWRPGNGRAVGPEKEEEIRARPIDG